LHYFTEKLTQKTTSPERKLYRDSTILILPKYFIPIHVINQSDQYAFLPQISPITPISIKNDE
jgi:hypothetical protein